MPEPEQPSRSNRGCYLVLVLVPILLFGIGYGVYYYVELKKNQSVEQRRNMPPHLVTFDRLTKIPEGEPYVDGESVIVEGYLLHEASVSPNGVGFRLNEGPFSGEPPDVAKANLLPRAQISRCKDSRVNCHDFDKYEDPFVAGGGKYFHNVRVYADSGGWVSGWNAHVRLHGKLKSSKRRNDSNEAESELEVTKIEIVK